MGDHRREQAQASGRARAAQTRRERRRGTDRRLSDFPNAAEAKQHLAHNAGEHPDFYAHAAQYDAEAWLLPYWDDVCRRVGVDQRPPGRHPERVDRNRPPSFRLQALYRRARPRPRKYVKTTEMYAILQDKDLTIAADQCPEFKALLNTRLTLSDLDPLD